MACIKVEMDEINAKIKYAQQIRDNELLKQSQNDFQVYYYIFYYK